MITLRTVLRINGVSSGATGLLLLVFPGFVAGLFGVASPVAFIEVGIFLLAFAAFVLFESTRALLHAPRIRAIVVLDILWVIGSIALIVIDGAMFTILGNILVAVVAGWVAMMAVLQARGLREVKA